jgi:uncharacterized membrane protein HdeD (DUF308 family)
MLDQYREERQKKAGRLRSVMDFAMGTLLILIGGCFLLYEPLQMKRIFNRDHSAIDYLIGALFILYGIWRIYRGYKKDYFR